MRFVVVSLALVLSVTACVKGPGDAERSWVRACLGSGVAQA